MLAYHSDPQLKTDLLTEVEKHRMQDQIVKGTYSVENGKWKGCAVGCSIHSFNLLRGESHKTSDHSAYERAFGIPRILARLEDRIFEGLPESHYLDWPARFLSAIPVGADLTNVWPKFACWLMVDPEHGVMRFAKTERTKASVQRVADLYEPGVMLDRAAYADAYADAYAAAYAADAAAAAAYAAYAAYAADAARTNTLKECAAIVRQDYPQAPKLS